MVSDDNGSAARELAARFDGSRYFDVYSLHSMAQAQEWLNTRKVDAIVHLQSDFSARLQGRQNAPVQLIINGIDANRARLIQGYAQGVLQKWSAVRRVRGEAAAVPSVRWYSASGSMRGPSAVIFSCRG